MECRCVVRWLWVLQIDEPLPYIQLTRGYFPGMAFYRQLQSIRGLSSHCSSILSSRSCFLPVELRERWEIPGLDVYLSHRLIEWQIYVWDLNNIENPFSLGTRTSRADDLNSVDWNKKIPHILATAGNGGFVTVWDVKTKRESLTLSNLGRKAVSAVAWHPENVGFIHSST